LFSAACPRDWAGFLARRGAVIPIVSRPSVHLPRQQPGPHAPTIILREAIGPIGMLVDYIRRIVPLSSARLLDMPDDRTFPSYTTAAVKLDGGLIRPLSPNASVSRDSITHVIEGIGLPPRALPSTRGTGLRLWSSLARKCCALALFLTGSIASAQIYKFRVYGTEDGLRNLAVLCMIQDHDGYVWAGTLNGLYRYDGDRFERMGAEHGFLESQIVSLAVTPDGSVWAGTSSGLAVFREHAFEAVHFAEPATLESQSSLAVDPATDALWVATKEGLASIQLSSYRRGPPKAVFASFAPHAIISAVSFGADGSIWFGSGGRLFQYEPQSGVLTRFDSSDGVPNDVWEAILSDGEGQLWARSSTRLISLRKGEKRFHADRLPPGEFGALALQQNGNVTIPTVQGLAIRDRNDWKILGIQSGLPMDSKR